MVKAYALKAGMPDSAVVTAQFTKGTAPANRSGFPWLSGFYDGGVDLAQMRDFETWRNRPADIVGLFISLKGGEHPATTWVGMQNANIVNDISTWYGAGYKVTLTVPLVAEESAGAFGTCANTTNFDSYHRALANRIKNEVGTSVIYLRLGHEATRGYPWSYVNEGQPNANPTDYKNCWNKVSHIYKDAVPNAQMVWNHLKNHNVPMGNYYPGDDAVDVIGIDPYDNCSWTGCVDSDAQWTKFLGSYNPSTGSAEGVGGLLAFAKAHGKKLSFCEWGPSQNQTSAYSPTHGSNNPYYVVRMLQFFKDNAADIAYEITYDEAPHQIWPRVDYLAKASDAYRAAWGR